MTDRVLTVALISFCLLLAALVSRNGDLALMALPFLTYLGAGILGSPSLEKLRLRAARSLNVTRSGEIAQIEVAVTIHNEGDAIVPLRLSDPPQPAMKIEDGDLHHWGVLGPGEETELRYTFETERGSFRWKTIRSVISDPFGLFEARLELPASAEIQVQPGVKKFRPVPFRPDSTLHSPGSIPARLGGTGTDFWGVREYHPGDPMRRLDWRLTARHPRQFFTKEFEQEEIADIVLILDARQRVNLQVGEDNLFEHTLSATASLAEMFLHQGHRASLIVFGDRIKTVFPGYSKVQMNRILRTLAKVQLGLNAADLSLDHLSLRMFSSHALVVILSPLAPSDWSIFPFLRARGNQVLLICPDPIDFALRSFAQDPPSRFAVRITRLERRLQLQKIARLHVRVVDWQVNRPLSPLVRSALCHTRGQRM
jgi:uncharacterized protein (DUF58 family)